MSDVNEPVINDVVEPIENELDASTTNDVQPSTIKKLKYKVDGEEIDEEIDLNNEDELIRRFQLAKASQKRMSEAAKQRKEAQSVIDLIKSNPIEAMIKLGLNPRDIAESYMIQEIERETMTPEELERRNMEAELERYREVEKQKQKEAEERRAKQLEDKYTQDFQINIMNALDASGLPKTPRTVARMAEYWSVSLENGYDPNPRDLVEMVRESYIQEQKELYGGFDGDTLIKFLGNDIVDKIRKTDLKRVQIIKSTPNKSPVTQPKPTNEKISWDEFKERTKQRIKG